MILQFGLQNDGGKPRWPHSEAEYLSSRTPTSKGEIWCQIAFVESKNTVFPEYCCLEVTEIASICGESHRKKKSHALRKPCAHPRPLTRTLTCRHFRRGAGTRGWFLLNLCGSSRQALISKQLEGFIFLILNKHVI